MLKNDFYVFINHLGTRDALFDQSLEGTVIIELFFIHHSLVFTPVKKNSLVFTPVKRPIFHSGIS